MSPALTQLQDILASGLLADSVRQNGERLLQRLSSPVRVALAGPDGDSKETLHDMLMARAVEGTVISILPFQGDMSFGQADICLWCTAAFEDAELIKWQRAPDVLKDHSFLVPLAPPDTAQALFAEDRLDALEDIVAEEFHSMFPIILEPQNTMLSSTFEALVAEIANLVRSGRAADRDNADFFVQTYKSANTASSGAADQDQSENDREAPISKAEQPIVAQSMVDGALIATYQRVFRYICDRASDLTIPISDVSDGGIGRILSICQEVSETVAEIFSETHSDDPDFLLLKEDVLCAADKLLLMSIEGGVTPAIAAVTTLLQTRREMEARIAA